MLDHLAILAPGLLGASVAKAARARNAARSITIWARRPETRDALRAQPFADTIADTPADAVRDADLVVLAAPVEKIIELAVQIAPALKPGAIVTDVGSVKARICRECAAAMPPHALFIGSHPMAGSAKSGWENADASLFENCTTFVMQPENELQVSAFAFALKVASVCDFWDSLGATPVIVTPSQHDEIVAHISHLPQALATTLAALLAKKNPEWRDYAGNGLRDTTRIAASDATMWVDIFQQNRNDILRALDACQAELAAFRDALEKNDWPQLRARLETGKQFRDAL
ncbi:prephenate dehydrogenase [Ereboglobus sp. PH5-10]|uniref:prephenate dehydrogenase n=1 Tax=Ereboglobus sp. PH5-10 TaxID=2940629 RepID=UPI0024063A8B|nr:prephenate dehydrogenase/arogenate dehydrogenase family protein [Ereboglobus sp. PH5-10]MDF9826663.1 prephenate dehydrogenase [Ereboglobus sp. PH5-10]